MTYAQLATIITKALTEEQRQQTVTIYTLNDEFYPVAHLSCVDETDVLAAGHPFLVVQGDHVAN